MTVILDNSVKSNIILREDNNNITIPQYTTRIIEIAKQGPQGPSGGGGSDFTGTAGEGGLQAYQIVYIDTLNTIKTASALNPTHINRVVGITTETVNTGENINIRIVGEVTNENWELTPGATYFLSDGGEITTNIPITGFYQRIGKALNTTTLIMDMGEPILIQN